MTAKAEWYPPHVRVFCSEVGEGVTPADFYSWFSSGRITLTPAFGVDELRAFNEALPIPYNHVELTFETPCAACDVSFLTSVKTLNVKNFEGRTLTVPTGVVGLRLDERSERVTVSGTENLTSLNVNHLDMANQTTTTTPCPKLRQLRWNGETLGDETLPCPVSDLTTLSAMTVAVNHVDPAFRFPPLLHSLGLQVLDGSVDVAQLTPLTRLQELDINTDASKDPLDLSGMTTLTTLNARSSPVTRLPASLVTCNVTLWLHADLSPLTSLTSLTALVKLGVNVTFPTGLKALCFLGQDLSRTNIGDVALETFRSGRTDSRIEADDLNHLPKTLTRIDGYVWGEWLSEYIRKSFPLIQ